MKRIAVLTIVLAATCGVAVAVTVSVNPDPPEAGMDLTITYDPTGGPLEGKLEVYLRYGFNGWHPTIDPDPLVTSNGAPYEITVPVPSQATEINFAFRDGGDPQVWDNNNGQNWNLAVTNGVPNPPSATVNPDPVQAGQDVTVTYNPAGRPLAGASQFFLHYGFNDWFPTISPDVLMSTNGVGGYEATVPVKSYAFEFDAAFNDGAGTWDTNDGFDWRFPVTGTIPGVTVDPDPPVAKQNVTIRYNPEDTPLENADPVYIHWGINDFADPYGPDEVMTSNGPVWEVTLSVPVPLRACNLAFVFNDTGDPSNPATIWDNNNGNDWNFAVTGCKPLQSELDGLYVAKRSDVLLGDVLHVGIPGDLENNGSAMVIFIDTPGMTGQTELRAAGAASPPDLLPLASTRIDLVSCTTVGLGTILPGEADYALYANYAGTQVHFNQYFLSDPSGTAVDTLTCCDGSAFDIFASQVYAGYTDVNDGNNVFEGDQGLFYEGGFDDSNTSGTPASVTTGLEIGIPFFNIGFGLGSNDNFSIFVALMPNNSGVQGQFSNQTLPAATNGVGYCDPAQMFPLRADMSPFASVLNLNAGTLPTFTGTADGVVVPTDYNGSGTPDELQICPVADPVPDTTVTLVPDAVQGQDVTVWYVSTNGPLENATAITLNYGFDGDPSLPNHVAMTPTNGFTGSEWIATVTMNTNALQFDLNVSSNGTVDDNTGQNWHFPVSRATAGAAAVEIVPDPAQAGEDVTITYRAIGRPLEGASQVFLHYGFNGWSPTIDPDPPMTDIGNCEWEVTVTVASFAAGSNGLNMVFNDGAGTWDNNNGNDWHFEVVNTAGLPPWVMDGYLDGCAKLVGTSTNGELHLYAGMRDGFLYVATERAQNGNDHFIFVAETPGAPAGQPWAKAGTVAQWDAYLAQEVDNGWVGWFDMGAGTNRSNVPQNTNLPYLEGQFDIAAELGAVPSTIHLAMGAYPTPNLSTLIATLQIPPGNGDENIDANEYLAADMLDIQIPSVVDIADLDCDGDVDVADYAIFEPCLNGPGNPPAGTCAAGKDADFDDDGDVDLYDFVIFQEHFTG